MEFSPSTFTVEINGVPAVVFQAKWQADADQICREWLDMHRDELAERGPGGFELPPMFKLRLARSTEKASYETEVTGFEFCGEVKIVRLIEFERNQTQAEHSAENVTEHEADENENSQRDNDSG